MKPRRLGDRCERYAGFDSQSIQHVNQIVGREVAGPRPARTGAAEAAARCVVGCDPVRQRREHVRERGPSRVVVVERDRVGRHAREHRVEHPRHLAGMRDADGVADRHLEDAEIREPRRDVGDARRRNVPLERTADAVERYPRTRNPAARARSQTCL